MNCRRWSLAVLAVTALAASLYFSLGTQTSAQIHSGPKMFLFLEPDFKGPTLEVTASVIDMPVVEHENGVVIDWNDQVRSLVVESGTWRLFQHGRCSTELDDTPLEMLDVTSKSKAEGWSCVLSATSAGPLRIANGAFGGFSHDISSIELISEKNLPDWVLPTP